MAETTGRVGIELEVQRTGDQAAFADAKRDLGGLEQVAGAAQQAMADVATAMVDGFRGIEPRLVAARTLLEEYRRELQATAETGREVAAEQAADLQRLEGDYQAAIEAVGRYRHAQQEVKQQIEETTAAAGGQIPQIRGLDDIFKLSGGTIQRWGAGVVAAFAAAETGWQIGTKLRGILNEITDGGYDEGVKRLATSFFGLADSINRSAEAQRVANERHVLEKNGIDATGMSLVQLHAAYIKLMEARQSDIAASDHAAASQRAFAESLRAPREELDKSVAALVEHARLLQSATRDLAPAEQLKAMRQALGAEVTAILADFAKLGEQPTAEVQKLATSLGLIETSASAAASGVREAAAAVASAASAYDSAASFLRDYADHVQQATDTGNLLVDEQGRFASAVQEVSTSLADALPNFDQHNERVAKAKEQSEALGTVNAQTAASFDKNAAAIAGLAAAQDAFDPKAEAMAEVAERMGTAVETAGAKAAAAAEGGLVKIVETTDAAGAKIKTITNEASSAAKPVGELGTAAGETAKGMVRITETTDSAGNRIKTVSNVAGEAAGHFKSMATALESVASHVSHVDALTQSCLALAEAAGKAASAVQSVANAGSGDGGAAVTGPAIEPMPSH